MLIHIFHQLYFVSSILFLTTLLLITLLFTSQIFNDKNSTNFFIYLTFNFFFVNLIFLDEDMQQLTLMQIEKKLQKNRRSLKEFKPMSYPNNHDGNMCNYGLIIILLVIAIFVIMTTIILLAVVSFIVIQPLPFCRWQAPEYNLASVLLVIASFVVDLTFNLQVMVIFEIMN